MSDQPEMSWSSAPLTVETLLEVIKTLPTNEPEFKRVIVGAPLLPEGRAFEDRPQQILWMHRKTFDQIPKSPHVLDQYTVTSFMGVPVETFTWEWHETVWKHFLRSLYVSPDTPKLLDIPF